MPIIVCPPVTNTARDYPFHVSIPVDSGISGFVMVEQVKSLDFRARKGKRVGQAPPETLVEVMALLDACIY